MFFEAVFAAPGVQPSIANTAECLSTDEWLFQRGLNEVWVCAQERIKSAAGVDARWQRLFDEHGDEITGLLRARLQCTVNCVQFRHA